MCGRGFRFTRSLSCITSRGEPVQGVVFDFVDFCLVSVTLSREGIYELIVTMGKCGCLSSATSGNRGSVGNDDEM